MRLVLHDAGFTGFQPQVAVLEGGYARYYLDLGDTALRVGAEYDGVSHAAQGALRRDRERHNWLQRRVEMCYFTSFDLYRRPSYLPETVREAAERARRRGLAR